jgi:Holliday junction resolvase
MAKNSRAKGIRGELEVAALLKEWGYEARRGQQYSGGGDSPDVVHNLPGFHIEVKRVEALNLYGALEQAKGDAKLSDAPVVFHKKNRKDWVVILGAEDFLQILEDLRAAENGLT